MTFNRNMIVSSHKHKRKRHPNFKRSVKHSHIYQSSEWRMARYAALQEAEHHCWYCWEYREVLVTDSLQVDHIISLEEGGAPYDINNLQVLCRDCHTFKTFGTGRKKDLLLRYKRGGCYGKR